MIGIISDTHENVRAIKAAVEILQQRSLELVIHCGDIISPPVLDYFRGLPMRFIFGNNDGERAGLKKKALELGFGEVNDTLLCTISGKSIFAYHGTVVKVLNGYIDSGEYDYVLTGHTHEMRDERVGVTRVINPGALFSAPRYSIAILDPSTDTLEFIDIPKARDNAHS